MFHKILVPLDGSKAAECALEPASQIARKFGSQVVMLRVIVPEEAFIGLPAMAPRSYDLRGTALHLDRQEAKAYLDRIKLAWMGLDAPVRTRMISGPPPEMIVAVAEDEAVDLIVMSTHGRSGLSRLIYGSVAEAVLRGAHLPLLLVPIKAGA